MRAKVLESCVVGKLEGVCLLTTLVAEFSV